MKKITIISSSLRKNSNSEILANEFIKGAKVNGNEIVDVMTEEEKTKDDKEVREEVAKEEVKEEKKEKKEKEVKEEVPVKEEDNVDLSTMNLTELKELAKDRGIKGYSKLKKDELLEVLK